MHRLRKAGQQKWPAVIASTGGRREDSRADATNTEDEGDTTGRRRVSQRMSYIHSVQQAVFQIIARTRFVLPSRLEELSSESHSYPAFEP